MIVDHNSSFMLDHWLVEPAFNNLTLGDEKHRVEPKVMSVLIHLSARAGHVVPKDEIQSAVWPDTFVGEDALTRCISVLRRIFEDDAHNPHFIRTVSKVGYCLLVEPVPVRVSHAEAPSPEASPLPVTEAADAHPQPASKAQPRTALRSKLTIGISAGLALAAGIGVWAIHAFRSDSMSPSFRTFQLTTNAGSQSRPAFSLDGKRLAFVWAKEEGGAQHIYIK